MGKLGTAFGVFDGHGGVLAAEYATKHLTNNVLRMHQQQKGGGSRNRDAVDARRTMHALQEAFDVTDRELLQLARRKNFSDGTTALLLLFAGTELAPDFDGDPAAAEVVPPADLIAAEWRVALRRVGAVFFSAKKLALAAGGR